MISLTCSLTRPSHPSGFSAVNIGFGRELAKVSLLHADKNHSMLARFDAVDPAVKNAPTFASKWMEMLSAVIQEGQNDTFSARLCALLRHFNCFRHSVLLQGLI